MSTVALAENFATNLRTEMARRSLSQSELSRQSGVRQATISEVLAGKREPTFETIEAIADVLKVNAAQFFLDPPAKAS